MMKQLVGMYPHILEPTEKGNRFISEALTKFHRLSDRDKRAVCHLLLALSERKKGIRVLEYLFFTSEYREDYMAWAGNETLLARYHTLKAWQNKKIN